MTQRIEETKQKTKEEYAKKVDEYFSQIAEMNETGSFNTNDIEKLYGNGIAAAKEVLATATEEIVKLELDTGSEADNKKKLTSPAAIITVVYINNLFLMSACILPLV